MILTQDEKELILSRRKLIEKNNKKEVEQQKCIHKFRYEGHSHNDDAFMCTKCGYLEFR